MSDFYVVWNPKHGPPSHRHEGRLSATVEAKRLAMTSPGAEFFVLHAVAVCRKPEPVETISLDGHVVEDDGLPF